ncbi:unnamed protein product [[Actinomadura] parvosata subsp. kistnae]|uniref:Uncharacterized protein n=1 Tax=[Actinomadura] parvosata subsp. kistnae TaxID=1909395 RepID=A0A1U9ZYN0_9ACTN|nr:hypothetical protein [Nonomuraea sp. ATCC 55076]AQZ63054.1 hypothetical protein BKM31_17715 [Nonomuraea sp. ATCC 55076]SPL98676.1 unnamed protein product [Actinomadura parvosata subsp. kistnae]
MVENALHLTQDWLTPSPSSTELNTQGLADFLRGFFGPLFLVTVSVVALFFLFTREITRFVQFLAVAITIGVIFYVPNVIEVLARGIAGALGLA